MCVCMYVCLSAVHVLIGCMLIDERWITSKLFDIIMERRQCKVFWDCLGYEAGEYWLV